MIAVDDDAPEVPEESRGILRRERRRDAIASRARWQFADRFERIIAPQGEEA